MAVDGDYADQGALLKHWDADYSPTPPKFDGRDHIRIAFDIGFDLPDVGNVDRLFAGRYAPQNAIRWWSD